MRRRSGSDWLDVPLRRSWSTVYDPLTIALGTDLTTQNTVSSAMIAALAVVTAVAFARNVRREHRESGATAGPDA